MDDDFQARLARVAERGGPTVVREAQAPVRAGFRFGAFTFGFVVTAGAYKTTAFLNDIQAVVENSAVVGLIAVTCGLVIVVMSIGMARTLYAWALGSANKQDPSWPGRVGRSTGVFAGTVVGIGPQRFAAGVLEKLQGIAGGAL